MSDTLTIELDRAIELRTLAGEPVAARALALVLSGDGRAAPPAAQLVFHVEPAVYARIVEDALFGLGPEVRGEPMSPFTADTPLELVARLRPDLAAALINRGGGAEDLVQALVSADSPVAFLALTEAWQTLSVMQAVGDVTTGYRTVLADYLAS